MVAGFGTAAASAAAAGLDGVEVNAGQHSLIRQFLSGLTNQRGDEWGTDRLRFARDVLAAVRGALGPDRVLGLRLSGDELAPWAGITPDQAPAIAAELAAVVDYLVVVRGAIYSAEKTRPDFHEPPGFNIELCRAVRQAVPDGVAVVLQGSVVDAGQAGWALEDGVADAVEMTRAQIADPDLVGQAAGGHTRAHPALHPLQPDLPGEGRPEPHRDVRRRTDERAGDRGPGLVRADRSPAGGARRGRRPGGAGDGARGCAAGPPRPRASRRPSGSVAWPRSPDREARSSTGWPRSWRGSPCPSSAGRPRGRLERERWSSSAAAAGAAILRTR